MPLTQQSPYRRVTRARQSPSGALNKQQRLSRWIELLDRNQTEMLRLLPPSWCLTPGEQNTLLTAGTALEVAYRDPVLRLDGLKSARLTDAMTFFGLSPQDVDRILAKSRYNEERSARDTVMRIRNVADKRHERQILYSLLLVSGLIAAALSFLF